MTTIALMAALLYVAYDLARRWRARRAERRQLALSWRTRQQAANVRRIDTEKANRKLVILPYHRLCVTCGAAFERSAMVVDMRCDACQAKAFDDVAEADREDWEKGGDIVKRGWQ